MEYLLLGAACVGLIYRLLIVGASARDVPHRRRIRAARRGPVVALDAVPEREDVVVEGRVVSNGPVLTAPLTGRSCVYYRAWARKTGSEARQVAAEDRCAFALEDGAARVTILVDRARLDVPEDWLSVDDEHARQQVEEFALGQQCQFDALRSQLTAREAVIEIGQTLRVAGRAVREPVSNVNDAQVDLRSVRGETVMTAEYLVDPSEEPRFISLAAAPGPADAD